MPSQLIVNELCCRLGPGLILSSLWEQKPFVSPPSAASLEGLELKHLKSTSFRKVRCEIQRTFSKGGYTDEKQNNR